MEENSTVFRISNLNAKAKKNHWILRHRKEKKRSYDAVKFIKMVFMKNFSQNMMQINIFECLFIDLALTRMCIPKIFNRFRSATGRWRWKNRNNKFSKKSITLCHTKVCVFKPLCFCGEDCEVEKDPKRPSRWREAFFEENIWTNNFFRQVCWKKRWVSTSSTGANRWSH